MYIKREEAVLEMVVVVVVVVVKSRDDESKGHGEKYSEVRDQRARGPPMGHVCLNLVN